MCIVVLGRPVTSAVVNLYSSVAHMCVETRDEKLESVEIAKIQIQIQVPALLLIHKLLLFLMNQQVLL